MVQIFEPEACESIEIEGFFEKLERLYDPDFPDSFIAASARLLQSLSNNRMLLIEHIGKRGGIFEIATALDFPQSFILARRDPFILRVNIWKPLSPQMQASSERKIYSYDLNSYYVGHNHNFRFLTVGHLGPGYETEICEIDPAGISGVRGDSVEFKSRRKETLSEGRVFYFRPFADVHEQYPPQTLSVSINLMLSIDKDRSQYEFDLKTGKILGLVTEGLEERARACIGFAEDFADAATHRILSGLADGASTPVIRNEALRALQ